MKAEELNTKKEIIEAALNLPNTSSHAFAKGIDKRFLINKKLLSLGFSEKDIIEMKEKRNKREEKRRDKNYIAKDLYNKGLLGFGYRYYWTHDERVSFLKRLKECKYYKETEEKENIHFPTENGRGWSIVVSKERKKNYYTDDPILVDFLYKKYNLCFRKTLVVSRSLGIKKVYDKIEDFLLDFQPEHPSKFLLLRIKEEFRKEKGKICFKIKGIKFNREFTIERVE